VTKQIDPTGVQLKQLKQWLRLLRYFAASAVSRIADWPLSISFVFESEQGDQDPILRLLNLQLQRQRCSKLEHFYFGKNFTPENVPSY
jgi:hypothetical protein